jgi:hypothetical protein
LICPHIDKEGDRQGNKLKSLPLVAMLFGHTHLVYNNPVQAEFEI